MVLKALFLALFIIIMMTIIPFLVSVLIMILIYTPYIIYLYLTGQIDSIDITTRSDINDYDEDI